MSTHRLPIPLFGLLIWISTYASAFQPSQPQTPRLALRLEGYHSRSGATVTRNERSKRQERVGQLVRSEVSRIIHSGNIKLMDDYLEDELRQRISVVTADVSPDLRQARLNVSIRAPQSADANTAIQGTRNTFDNTDTEIPESAGYNPAVDKRRAYAWLVRNTKPIRHTLAQRLSHMKSCPNLSFVQVDVAAAVDVMYLIDQVAAGHKRDDLGFQGEGLPSGVVGGIDFDEELDDEEWDEDFDFV